MPLFQSEGRRQSSRHAGTVVRVQCFAKAQTQPSAPGHSQRLLIHVNLPAGVHGGKGPPALLVQPAVLRQPFVWAHWGKALAGFRFFFTGKFWMLHQPYAIVAFPGGCGTLGEVLEVCPSCPDAYGPRYRTPPTVSIDCTGSLERRPAPAPPPFCCVAEIHTAPGRRAIPNSADLSEPASSSLQWAPPSTPKVTVLCHRKFRGDRREWPQPCFIIYMMFLPRPSP